MWHSALSPSCAQQQPLAECWTRNMRLVARTPRNDPGLTEYPSCFTAASSRVIHRGTQFGSVNDSCCRSHMHPISVARMAWSILRTSRRRAVNREDSVGSNTIARNVTCAGTEWAYQMILPMPAFCTIYVTCRLTIHPVIGLAVHTVSCPSCLLFHWSTAARPHKLWGMWCSRVDPSMSGIPSPP